MSKWHPVAGALAAVRLYTKKSQQRPSQLPLNGVGTASVHLYISQMNHFNGALVLKCEKIQRMKVARVAAHQKGFKLVKITSSLRDAPPLIPVCC